MLEEKRLRLVDANILYLIGAILFFTLGFYFQSLSLKWGLIITQYLLILLPPIIYLKMKKIPIKKTMRFNKISIKHSILVVFITLFMYPAAVFANALFMALMSMLGNLNIPELPTATNPTEYIVLMFIISVSAGICEEVFFRGFILPGYENLGTKKAIIISSILFGIFHFNLYNLLGPIVLGLVFSYLIILTNSIYAGMIGHIVNNGFAVTLGYVLNKFAGFLEESQEAAPEISTTLALLINVLVFGMIAIITSYLAFRLIKIIKKDREKQKNLLERNNLQEEDEKYEKTIHSVSLGDFIPLLLVLPLFLLIAIIQIREIIGLG
ncbi:abortive infection protein [Clostridium aceticum]|uniref:Abortive infection protein n=1 Tax=Clostridium aceticum TaxID=84022 RepID=A0A0D8IE86_9CLOT|nr:type II CAAX endopeptidase family protein [Clostridium aceticum]AKL94484.1 abortive infection protein [Clostridium aceticum]KJF28302.1 abortive infection protein [Clostridium aceticum]